MSIYTKTGDDGDTMRSPNHCIRKSDARIWAVGSLDELSCHAGWAAACCADGDDIADELGRIQGELLAVGALISACGTDLPPGSASAGQDLPGQLDQAVARMERHIDRIAGDLPPLRQFLLPGGVELAARLHVARAVARRAERVVVEAFDAGCAAPKVILRYLNRLSDLIYMLARSANARAGRSERTWPG